MEQIPAPELQDHPEPTALQPKGAKGLMIALIASAVFLLAAAGIGIWLLVKPGGTSTVKQQPTGDGSDAVKALTFVAPSTLPAAYAMRQQNTHTTAATYYFDPTTACGIATHVAPLTTDNSQPKGAAIKIAENEFAYGVTTANAADGTAATLRDADGQHEYSFASTVLDQNVAIEGVPYNQQHTAVFYKQFGVSVASISYACKADTWETKKPELASLVAAFSVKTER